jgi:UDP-glucuronate 4-epimerase
MTRTFTHVDDVVDGIIALLNKKDLKYEIYNFSGKDSITLSDFIDLIGKHVGKQAEKRFLPMQAGDIPVALVDISKAQKDLDYNPKVSIEEGVKDFAEWFLKNKEWLLALKDS